jgi:WD40 repeat protein
MKQLLLFLLLTSANIARAQVPELIVPTGHTGITSGAAFNNAGTVVATTAEDNTIKLWNIAEARLLVTLYGHKDIINQLRFGPGDKYLLSYSSAESTAIVWDLTLNTKHLVFDTAYLYNIAPVFSSNGKYLALATENTVDIWDVASAKKVRSLTKGLNSITSLAFVQDDKAIAAIPNIEENIYYWDLATGKKKNITTHDISTKQVSFLGNTVSILGYYMLTTVDLTTGKTLRKQEGNYGQFTKAIFSKDGRTLFNPLQYRGYEVKGGDTVAIDAYFFQPQVTDLTTYKTTAIKADVSTIPVNDYAYSEDLEHIALLSDTAFFIYNKKNNKYSLQATIPKAKSFDNEWITVSADGRYYVTADYKRPAIVYSNEGNILATLKGNIVFDPLAHFSDDGKYIHTGKGDELHQCWDVQQGKFEFGCSADSAYTEKKTKVKTKVAIDSSTQEWTVYMGSDTVKLQGYRSSKLFASHTYNRKYIVTYWGDDDSIIRVWDRSGKQLYSIEQQTTDRPFFDDNSFYMVLQRSYSKERLDKMWDNLYDSTKPINNTYIPNFDVYVVDIATGKKLFKFQDSTMAFTIYPDFTDGSNYFILLSDDIHIWNTKNWNEMLSLQHICGGWSPGIAFNSKADRILISCINNTTLFEAGTSKPLFNLPGSINYSGFSADEKYILTGSTDNRLKVWDAFNGKLLYTWFGFKNNEYLITDEFGHYDGTEAARKALYFNCGNEIIELSQVKDQLWVPCLAERIMKNDVINAPKLSDINICGVTPVIKANKDNKAYRFNITPRKGGIGEVALLVNNIEVKKYKPAELKLIATNYELNVPADSLIQYFVAGKENTVTVKAFTSKNEIASRGVSLKQTLTMSSAPPNLFAVMVGVSDYKGTELDLQYAAKDATDISKAIAASAKKLLNTDSKEHVFMYDLTTSDKHYLLPEKKSIEKVLKEIGAKASPNDILFIFFAGHGVTAGDKKQFYFLTADASKDADVAATGISTAELTEWIKPSSIKAQKRILIFDACNSGQAINDLVKIGKENENYVAARSDNNSLQLKAIDKLNERSGLFILSASATNQSAYEMGRLSQGLLTYSLLKAIKEQSEILDDNKLLNVSKWFTAAEKTVEDIVRETGNRQEPQLVSTTSFNIGIVDNEVIAGISLPEEKPLFTASNFQNSDEAIADDDIEMSKYINQALFEIASRGMESKISYVTATQSPDAYTLSGRYDVNENNIKARINIKQGKETKYRFDITGAKENLQQLAKEVVQKASEWILQRK